MNWRTVSRLQSVNKEVRSRFENQSLWSWTSIKPCIELRMLNDYSFLESSSVVLISSAPSGYLYFLQEAVSKYMKDKRVNEGISMDLPRLNCTWLTWLPSVMRTWVSSVPSQQRRPTVYMASKLREVCIHLYSERCTVLDSTIEDTNKLERIQQRETWRALGGWSTHIQKVEKAVCSIWRRLNRFSLKCPQLLHLVLRRARLISGVHSKGKRGTDTNCNKENFDEVLVIKITVRVIKHWKRLAWEMVKSPWLKIFKTWLHDIPSKLI